MLDTWFSLNLFFLIGLSAWGWGTLILKPAGGNRRMSVGYPITVGMAGWCFIGGVLNLLHLATRTASIALLVLGIGYAISEFFARLRARRADDSAPTTPHPLLPAVGIFLLLLILTVFQLPPAIMNVGDDFETYLIRPVRMLDTGTLGGDIFDGMGMDSLGGHFFLQGFLFAFLPLPYMNGLDHVFCLAVCCVLIHELGNRQGVPKGWTLAAGLLFLLVHPQTVNVSSVYSTSLFAMGLAASLMPDTQTGADGKRRCRELLIPALLLGALATVKTIAAFYGAFFGAALMIVRFANRKDTATWLKEHAALAGLALLSVASWFACLADRYRLLFVGDGSGTGYTPPADLVASQDFSKLWGVQNLFYGGNLLGYNLILLLLLLFTITLLVRRPRSGAEWQLPIAATGIGVLATFVLNNVMYNYQTAIRYSVPLVLAGLPLTVLAIGWNLRPDRERPAFFVRSLQAAAGIAAAIAILFVYPSYLRLRQFAAWQTYIPFAVTEAEAQHNAEVFDPRTADFFRSFQQAVPEGEGIFTCIKLPFLLDYARNPIHIANNHGMMAPWVHRPPLSGTAEDMRVFLLAHGIHYVLLERDAVPAAQNPNNLLLLQSGNAVYHKTAIYDIAIHTGLNALASQSVTMAQQQRFVIFRVSTE